jgi:hypothetical protein
LSIAKYLATRCYSRVVHSHRERTHMSKALTALLSLQLAAIQYCLSLTKGLLDVSFGSQRCALQPVRVPKSTRLAPMGRPSTPRGD